MEKINFAECTGSDILAFLLVLNDAYVKIQDNQDKYNSIREECLELKQKLVSLEKKLTHSEKTALKIERLKKEYSKILEKEYFAEIALLNSKSIFNCTLERYEGLIDEKYIYDGTLRKVINLFIDNANIKTVEQALKVLEKN